MDFSVCETPDVLRVIYFIKIIINIIKIVVPIVLIIMVSFDCAKGVMSGDKKVGEVLKASKNRIISAILVFVIPWIVNLTLVIVDEETTYESCWVNAEASTIAIYQEKWDAEEERKKKEEDAKRQEELLKKNPFSSNISFDYKFENDGNYIAYALYTPSTAKSSDSLPLIVWLHGFGDGSDSRSKIETRGLPRAIAEWDLNNFNAYVLCPQILNTGGIEWYNVNGRDSVNKLVTMIIEKYNINRSKIIIAGHSNGGTGALSIANQDTNNYYSTVVSVSGGSPGGDLSHLRSLRGRAYVGSPKHGEAEGNYNYAKTTLADIFGSGSFFSLAFGHAEVSWEAFKLDDNQNKKSDLIEWMLEVENSSNTGNTGNSGNTGSTGTGSDNNCYFCTGSPADGKFYTNSPKTCNGGTWVKVDASKCYSSSSSSQSGGTSPNVYAGTKKIDVTDIGCTLYYDINKGTVKTSLNVNSTVADELHEILKKSCAYINKLDFVSSLQTAGVGSYNPAQFNEGDYHAAALAIDLNNQWTYTSPSGKKYTPYSGQGDCNSGKKTCTWERYTQFICEVCDGKEDCKYNINYNIYVNYFKPKGWCWGGDWGSNYFDPMHFQKSLGSCSTPNKNRITCK